MSDVYQRLRRATEHIPDTRSGSDQERLAGLDRLASATAKFLLTYEGLHADPAREFRRLLGFLSAKPIDEVGFKEALAASSLDAMQAYEIAISREGRAREVLRLGVDNWTGNVNDLKVRRGAVGGFRDECPALDQLDHFPNTRAALAEQLDPRAFSDTHWTVGTPDNQAGLHAPLVARQRQLAAKIDELQAKNAQLRATLRGRDTIIAKLKARLGGSSADLRQASTPDP